MEFDLLHHGISVPTLHRNLAPGRLYEEAVRLEKGFSISKSGALVCDSGRKTGRSPKDKRVVEEAGSADDIWWGDVNIKLDEDTFNINFERAIDYLNTREELFVLDGFAGWDPKYRLKIRVICTRPYHALFMHNMLIRPTDEELENFGKPDYVVFNSGAFPANRYTKGMNSDTSVVLHLARKQIVILGTEYAGEMKKCVFTIMNYLMPKKGHLPLHSSCNVGAQGDVCLFFGLSGTGKTALSAVGDRKLIGDDEHVWTDKGVWNIEGGCYAKCVGLSQ